MESSLPARISKLCFLAAVLASGMALLGWAYDITWLRSFAPYTSTIKINTAIGLLGLSIAGYLRPQRKNHRVLFWLSHGMAFLIAALALLNLSQFIFSWNAGIDQFFKLDVTHRSLRWPPGRTSPFTTTLLLLMGLSMGATAFRSRFLQKLSHGMIIGILLSSIQVLVCYNEGITPTLGFTVYIQVAFYTAIILLLICAGALLARPREGVMKILSSRSTAGKISRQLLFFAVAIPPSLSWIQVTGERLHYWDSEVSALIRVIGLVMFFSWVAFKTGASLMQAQTKEKLSRKKLELAIASRDEFLSIASHELRTPITGMKLRAEIMKRSLLERDPNVFDPDRVTQLINDTNQGLDRMTRLVEDMLDISRIDAGNLSIKLELEDLSALIRDIVDRYMAQLETAKVRIRFELRDEVIVTLDRSRIEQAVSNLLTNVIRYAPNAELLIRLEVKNERAILTFHDGGPGIAPQNRDRVFKRFERLISANDVSGLGLGLYIVRELIQAHDGTIRVEGEPGRGARFVIELPRALPFESELG